MSYVSANAFARKTVIFPWNLLEKPGDYVFIPEKYRPYAVVKVNVKSKNKASGGVFKYAAREVQGGTYLILEEASGVRFKTMDFKGEYADMERIEAMKERAMSAPSVYPWHTLQRVGDYFIITNEWKGGNTYAFMNATVAQRNSYFKGKMKYACVKTTYGCIVFLAQTSDNLPEYDYEPYPNIYAVAVNIGRDPDVEPLGNRPYARELTQQEKVERMSPEMRRANLPWWYEYGKLVWNPLIPKRQVDVDAFFASNFTFGPDDPYPEFYALDDALMRTDDSPQEGDEEEDWGDEGVFPPAEEEEDGNA